MMYYLPVIVHPEGQMERLPSPTRNRDEAMMWMAYKKRMDPSADTWLLFNGDPTRIEDAYLEMLNQRLEPRRTEMELVGEPGDHDIPYQFDERDGHLGLVHLLSRVQRGEIGGEFDGDSSVAPVRVG